MIEKIKYPYVFTTKARCASFFFDISPPAYIRERSPRSQPIWRSLKDTCHDLPPKEYLTPGRVIEWILIGKRQVTFHSDVTGYWNFLLSWTRRRWMIYQSPRRIPSLAQARNIITIISEYLQIEWWGGPFNLWRDTSVKGEKRAPWVYMYARETLMRVIRVMEDNALLWLASRRREKKRVKTQGEKLLYCVCALKHIHTHQLCCLFTTSFFSDIRPHGPRRYSTRSARGALYTSNFWGFAQPSVMDTQRRAIFSAASARCTFITLWHRPQQR